MKDPRIVPMMTKVSRAEALAVRTLAKQQKITKSSWIHRAILRALLKSAA